mgnify:CR=1 FL=1
MWWSATGDLQCGSVPVIGCDWNKDGKIDDQDYYMFKLIFGTHQGQAGYLSYVDMNHDGMINTRDMIFVERCMGLASRQFCLHTAGDSVIGAAARIYKWGHPRSKSI